MDLVSKVQPDGRIYVEQGVVAGCSGGTYENICAVAEILRGKSCGNGAFKFSVYPDSMPTYLELVKNGAVADIVSAGGIFRECFCGPCFGAGDTPANGEFTIRHTTRNFPNREGSKPGEGQISAVALMDARSIAATAANGGYLTAASEVCDKRVHRPRLPLRPGRLRQAGLQRLGPSPSRTTALKFGPNIKDWPEQPALSDDLLVKIVSYITDPVTTTDELIPSGETSSFRSNPLRLAEFTLSRKDPAYVPSRQGRPRPGRRPPRRRACPPRWPQVYAELAKLGYAPDPAATNIGSAIFANKPGDGSAREQAASCQRVLGGAANFACEYATKRYRSNCINWGMLPFLLDTPNVLDDGRLRLPARRAGKALLDAADQHRGRGGQARRRPRAVHRAPGRHDRRRAPDPGGRLPHQLLQEPLIFCGLRIGRGPLFFVKFWFGAPALVAYSHGICYNGEQTQRIRGGPSFETLVGTHPQNVRRFPAPGAGRGGDLRRGYGSCRPSRGGVQKFLDILSPFAWGIVLAYVLDIPARFFASKLFGGKRGFAVLLSYLLLFSVVALLLSLVVPQLVQSITSFVNSLSSYEEDIQNALTWVQQTFGIDTATLESYVGELTKELQNWFKSVSGQAAQAAAGAAAGGGRRGPWTAS